MALLHPWLQYGAAVVVLCCLGVEAFPRKADCGSSDFVRQEILWPSLSIGENERDKAGLTLDPSETAVIVVKRLNSRRHGRRRRRRQQEFTGDFLNEILCDGDGEDDDDVGPQPLFDDDDNDEDGCGDLEDDDAQTEQQNIGGLSHYFLVRVLDESSAEISYTSPADEDGDIGLATRGQQGTCAHPTAVEIVGEEGQGDLQVSVAYLRRDPSVWNLASISFDDAKTIEEGNLEWCGNVNWLRENPGSCTPSTTTPKWRLWLNPKDKLLLTAELQGREDISDFEALKVSLKLYSDKGATEVGSMMDRNIKGLESHTAKYTHRGSTSGWFYLELVRDKRHVYEYRLAFQFKRKCRDNSKKKFTFPQDLKDCAWLSRVSSTTRDGLCESPRSNASVVCQKTCGRCTACPDDSPSEKFYRRQKKCKSLPKSQESLDTVCSSSEAGDICSESCGKCPTPTPI